MSRLFRSQRDPLENQYTWAEQLFARGQLQEALQECKSIIEQNPHHARARFMAACIFEMEGAYERAIALIESIIIDQPPSEFEVSIRANLALDYLELGQYGRALDCCQRALELDPNNFAANNNAAYILNQAKRFKESLPYAQNACEVNPNDAGALGNLGEACLALGRYEEAVDAFNRSIRLTKPGDVQIVMRMSKLEIARRKLKAQSGGERQRSEPKSASDFHQEAKVAWDQGKLEEATQYFKLAVSIEPNNSLRYYHLAHAVYRQGLLEEAVEEFGKAIELDPTKWQYYVDLAEVWLSLDKPHEALENLIFGRKLLLSEGENEHTMIERLIGKMLGGLFNRLGLRSSRVSEAYVAQKEQELAQRLQLYRNRYSNRS